jgi:hypothetical protein
MNERRPQISGGHALAQPYARRIDEGVRMEQFATREEHREGAVARGIEQQTAKLPTDIFLWAALGAIGTSAALQIAGRKEVSNFIGEWVPTLLIFGLYNKMVKLLGSDPNPAYAGSRS